jgi:hypothetical protein
MAEPTQIVFSYKEVVEALLKKQGIHEGIWGIHVRFGIQAMNAGGSADDLLPVAVVPLVNIGIQKFEELSSLSVDASVVNPKPAGST